MSKRQYYTDLTNRLDHLPLLPAVVTTLMSLREDDDNYFETVLPLAQQDPTFAVRLIKLANSTAFHARCQIVDLNSAIARIGAREIASLVTSMAVMQVFVPRAPEVKLLWLHSVQVAVAGRIIAQRFPVRNATPAEAYLCGLLHDIGRFVMLDVASKDVQMIDESGWDSPSSLVAAERELLGIDHTEIGWRICKKWQLPDHVATVVREHHSSPNDIAIQHDAATTGLVALTQLADGLSVLLQCRDGSKELDVDELSAIQQTGSAAAAPVPVSAEQLLPMSKVIEEESLRLCSALGLRF